MISQTRLVKITRYVSVLGGGVFTGGALVVLVLEWALRRLDGPTYVRVRQIEHLYFPWYIGATFGLTLIAVVALVMVARKAASPAFRPAAVALALLIFALLVSFAVNVPINLDQIGWNAQAPPPDWASIRNRWQIAHALRTLCCVTALGCLGAAVIDKPFDESATSRGQLEGPRPPR